MSVGEWSPLKRATLVVNLTVGPHRASRLTARRGRGRGRGTNHASEAWDPPLGPKMSNLHQCRLPLFFFFFFFWEEKGFTGQGHAETNV
jgi:hypothetical protein